jgi:hypothetical protein
VNDSCTAPQVRTNVGSSPQFLHRSSAKGLCRCLSPQAFAEPIIQVVVDLEVCSG